MSSDEYAKEDARDFVLWKSVRSDDEAVGAAWDAPFGRGRPGWHLECSAMALALIGERLGARVLDIHAGAVDLIFPHHEDEIAQSCAHTGERDFARVWMHGEFLTLADAKMAKSAGNIIRVSELPEKGFEPLAFRYLALTAHYRSKLDFTEAAMHAAASGLARLRRAVADGADDADGGAPDLASEPLAGYRARFTAAISEDLGTPAAVAIAHAVAGADDLTPGQKRALLLDFDRVFGVDLGAPPEPVAETLPDGADALLERRAGILRQRCVPDHAW